MFEVTGLQRTIKLSGAWPAGDRRRGGTGQGRQRREREGATTQG